MIYVFEDHSDSVLSKLLKLVTLSNKCMFLRGINRVVQYIDEHFQDGTEEPITVFMDLPIGNRDVLNCYKILHDYQRCYSDKLTIVPIFCMEYYILEYFYSRGMYRKGNKKDIEDALLITPYIESQTHNSVVHLKSVEGHCKTVLFEYTVKCFGQNNGKGLNKGFCYVNRYCNLPECFYKSNIKNICEPYDIRPVRMLEYLPCYPPVSEVSGKSVSDLLLNKVCQLTVDICNVGNTILNKTTLANNTAKLDYIDQIHNPSDFKLSHFRTDYINLLESVLSSLKKLQVEVDDLDKDFSIHSIAENDFTESHLFS